jgi:SNF2 family DNA or RNA helicase
MVFYSLDFSLKNYIQMCGRIHRIGQTKKCVYVNFIVSGTIDGDVYKSIKNKEDFQIQIYKK